MPASVISVDSGTDCRAGLPSDPAESSWLFAQTRMAQQIRAHAWAESPGPIGEWPPHLRTVVNLMLDSSVAMAVAWGPGFQLLYNDAYVDILAEKHPQALGSGASAVFPEIWDKIGPMFRRVLRGEALACDDADILLKRGDQLVECSFTFSYNPIRNSAGKIEGLLAIVTETTGKVARERQRAQISETTLSAITDFAYTFDCDGRFVYINKALLDLWGLQLEQAVGKNFFDLDYPPELASRLQRQIQEVFTHKQILRDETAYVSPGGVSGYYEYILSPVLGNDGSVELVAGSTRDITARKQLERQLLNVQERMESALSAGAIGTWSWDVTTDTVVADRNLARFFSISPAEASGAPIIRYLRSIHPDDRDRVATRFQEVLARGKEMEMECRVVNSDGSIRWVAARGSVQRNRSGQAVSFPGVVLDITDRKRVAAEREMLASVLANSPDFVGVAGVDGIPVFANPVAMRIMGAESMAELLRMPVIDFFAPEEREFVRDVVLPTALREGRWQGEMHLMNAHTGTRTPILYDAFRIDDPDTGKPAYLATISRDLTERLKLERQLHETIERLETAHQQLQRQAGALEAQVRERTARLQDTVTELEAFSYSISHDLRGPLRVMQSFAQALREDCGEHVSAVGQDYIRRIVAAGDRMDRVIHDVLVYSRIARTELPLEPIPLEDFVHGLLETYPQFHNARAAITIRDQLPVVRANGAALTQCFANLLGNAIKFVPHGTAPSVEIFAERRGERVRVAIRDNGIGIPRDAQEQIFGIFCRLDNSFEGTGIGLAIVRKAVERMGGRIHVTSEPGRGSTFSFDLALADGS